MSLWQNGQQKCEDNKDNVKYNKDNTDNSRDNKDDTDN